jgi:FAD-linked sulfhydryl oxidase
MMIKLGNYYLFSYNLGPVTVESNKDLSIWLCEIHNDVNEKLGKERFDCSEENIFKRWKTGFDHCNDK